jgi:chemosensory pili system protein ChpA (sensor histidine kinase/response regulator)
VHGFQPAAEGALENIGQALPSPDLVKVYDALEKLRDGSFDIVFTDLEMPRMHGYDFIRQLRMLAAYQDLPVVVVSSRSGQKHQDHARSVGATDYITKPFSAQSLEATIRTWLRG